jgi:hypothetical protein
MLDAEMAPAAAEGCLEAPAFQAAEQSAPKLMDAIDRSF